MIYEKVKSISFSPTGNSKKVADAIAKGLNATVEDIDLTPKKTRLQKGSEIQNELAIISTPVYLGRVPNEASFRIRRISAKNTPAILVVTYGNRAYEDALMELSDIASECGFTPIAWCAFLGEHSMSSSEKPVAGGRPDGADLAEAEEFGGRIREKLEKVSDVKECISARLPGLRPYTVRTAQGVFVKPMSPYVDEEKCTKCGKCVEVCPVGAVAIEDLAVSLSPRLELSTRVVNVDQHICLWCAACVRACPAKAFVRRPQMIATNERLFNLFPDRKKNETFL